jgi:MYXO-CTERM domain-containing protein
VTIDPTAFGLGYPAMWTLVAGANDLRLQVVVTPEPSGMLLAAGFVGLLVWRRRRLTCPTA